jgi:hypothetical protein
MERESTTLVKYIAQIWARIRAATHNKDTKEAGDQTIVTEIMLAPPRDHTLPDEADLQAELEADVQRIVQKLWDLLPLALSRKAARIWVSSMLQTDDVATLDKVERGLGSDTRSVYNDGSDLAMMKKIRLEMIRNSTEGSELGELELQATEVTKLSIKHGHRTGYFKETAKVIIEWMYYDPSWHIIPARERTVVMALKAKSFCAEYGPQRLHFLQCIGFFEGVDNKYPGYAFVYQVPEAEPQGVCSTHEFSTLLHLLMMSQKQARKDPYLNQPLLEDKFRLAHLLAESLGQFHTIGWLHENLHSNNIVFFEERPSGQSIDPAHSKIIAKPFLLGLHKCRPGSDAWHTQGPSSETDYLDYQHPDYAKTKRYRNGYDYYSLGLILLEIGLWTPLKAWSRKAEHLTLKPHELREVFVSKYVPRLGPRMGNKYQGVVRLLLTDALDPDPAREQIDPKLERSAFCKFLDEVVDPLVNLL